MNLTLKVEKKYKKQRTFLILFPFSVISLSIILIGIRFLTLNLFLKIGCLKLLNFKLLLQYRISVKYIKELVLHNWPFIIIGSVSILNWRIATIIISKVLSSFDVAVYEIALILLSLAIIVSYCFQFSQLPAMTNSMFL